MANRTPKRGKVHPEYYSTALLVRQAVEMGARWLVMENVGGLLWSQEGKVELAEMRAECARQGLRWLASIVNSNTCGIAQIRRRLFVVVGPEYVHIPHGSDYIPPENAETPMMACEGSKGSLEREMRWPKASAAVDASPASRHANWTGATPDRARNGSVVSVRASEHLGGRRTDRATQGRTLAECAALQQVPLEPLAGMSKRVAHELCGNAVPPPLAEHVARSLIKHEQQEMLVPAWGR
jgi:site-specific DNA-cytosine methylase